MPFDLGYQFSRFNSSRPGYNGTSLQAAAQRFPSDDACFDHVMIVRQLAFSVCPKCGKEGRWYRKRDAKYVQHPCGAVLSPLAGTVFHATKLPLRLWFYAMLHFANSSEGVTGGLLQRQLGISYLAAYRMAQMIRRHMAALEAGAAAHCADHQIHVRLEILHHVRGTNNQSSTANVLLASNGSRVDTSVLEEPRRHQVKSALRLMHANGPWLTTCYRTARVASAYGSRRPLASYAPTYFIDHPAETDLISGFLSYFLWPFQTNHKHVSRTHLWLYLKEFQFRYNRRNRSGETYWDMVNAFPVINGASSMPEQVALKAS